jgi:hypothetical protein
MDLTGLDTVLNKENKNLVETLQELQLEYAEAAFMPPLQRLLFMTGMAALQVNQRNKSVSNLVKFYNSSLDKKVEEEFADI